MEAIREGKYPTKKITTQTVQGEEASSDMEY